LPGTDGVCAQEAGARVFAVLARALLKQVKEPAIDPRRSAIERLT